MTTSVADDAPPPGRAAAGELWLVRHAPTTWTGTRYCGRSDPPLTPSGRAVARQAAVELARVVSPGSRVIASPLRRARSTAAPIARALRSQVEADGRWREVDFGALEGRTFDEVQARWPAIAAALLDGRPVDWPDGEQDAALRDRIRAALADLRAATGPTIVVTHGGPIRAALDLVGATAAPPAPGAWVRIDPGGST